MKLKTHQRLTDNYRRKYRQAARNDYGTTKLGVGKELGRLLYAVLMADARRMKRTLYHRGIRGSIMRGITNET